MSFLANALASPIHVIDPDYRRRAALAREFNSRRMHAEIYEDVAELGERPPHGGYVFAADVSNDRHEAGNVVHVLRAAGITIPVVVYAHDPAPERIVTAMLEGALDYLEWPINPLLLDCAFQRLMTEGERRSERARLSANARGLVGILSPRERDVLDQLVRGMSNKEIADVLQISPRTVEIHRGNMMRKLNANSPADAVRLALYAGLDKTY